MIDGRRIRLGLQRISPKVWVAIGMVAGPLCLFGPGLVAGRVLFWGTPLLQFAPWRLFALSTALSGHMPLWNPLVGLGAPLLANYQSALLYPPNWIQALVGVVWGQALLVTIHLIWAGCGMAYLGRRLGLSWLGACIAGVAFGLSGYLVARSGFLSINASVAWVPWIISAVDRLAGQDGDQPLLGHDRGAVWMGVAAFTGQWLAGHAQVAWYSLLLAVAWAIWRTSRLPSRPAWAAIAARLGAVMALSFFLAAPQLLPTLEYMVHSQRVSSVGRELAMTYSFWPWRLSGLIAPNLFGSPVTGDYWGYGNFWEDALYIGVLPACLALAAIVSGLLGRAKRSALIRFLTAISVIAFLIALGKNTPIFPFLYEHVPTFALFQAPTRWSLWVVFALCLLAGVGADEWRVATGRWLYWLRLGTAGAVSVALGAGAAWLTLKNVHTTFITATAVSGGWLAIAGALSLTRREAPGALWKAAVAAVVVADLTLAGVGLNPLAEANLYDPATDLAKRLPNRSRLYITPEVEYQFKYETLFRFDTYNPGVSFRNAVQNGLPNTSMMSGLATVNNFDPILPGRYATWTKALSGMSAAQRDLWLDAMDIGLAATTADASGTPVYQTRQPVGRAWFVETVTQADSASDALAQASDRAFNPFREAAIETREALDSSDSQPVTGTATLLPTNNPNRLDLQVSSQTGGWLVISAMNYPGWVAALDGHPVQLYPADYVLSAVHVPPGQHEIVLSYRSLAFQLGLLLALGGLAILAAWGIKGRRAA